MTMTIEMKWKSAARMCIAALENGTDEGKRIAREEIMRMADVADMAVELQGEISKLSHSAGGAAK